MAAIRNVVYMVGKRTSANSSTARHLDDGTGKPLCKKQAKSGKSYGSGYVLDRDVVDCKRCLKLMAALDTPAAVDAAPAAGTAGGSSTIATWSVDELVEENILETVTGLQQQINALTAQNAALRAALEPVLAIARDFKLYDTDPEVGWSSNATGKGKLLKVGDLYALLAVVEGETAEAVEEVK